MKNTRVYTVEEVAQMLNMKPRTAYEFCKSTDKFQVDRVGPRSIRINKESFDKWMPYDNDVANTI